MGETEEDGAKPLRQPKKDGSQKPIRQAENEIPVFALFAILANMDPRTMSELIAKKKKTASPSALRDVVPHPRPHAASHPPGRRLGALRRVRFLVRFRRRLGRLG